MASKRAGRNKPRKVPTKRSLENKLWSLFSLWVRLSAVAAAGSEYIPCCSCGETHHWKEMHAGHFVSRNAKAVKYDPRNVHTQCVRCNMFEGGNPAGYGLYMLDHYGRQAIEELNAASRRCHKFSVDDLQAMIAEVKAKLEKLQ